MGCSTGGAKPTPPRHARLGAAVSMGHGGEIGLAKIVARAPGAVEREISSSRAIAAGPAPKNAGKVVAAPARAGDRVVGVLLVERGALTDGRVKQRDLRFDNIPEKTGDPRGHLQHRYAQ